MGRRAIDVDGVDLGHLRFSSARMETYVRLNVLDASCLEGDVRDYGSDTCILLSIGPKR